MIIFIAAIGKNRELGFNGKLPWEYGKQKADIERFHALAKGGAIVLGERTYHNYPDIQKTFHSSDITVLSRNLKDLHDAKVLDSIAPLIKRGKNEDLWVIGGGSLFTQFLPYASKMYLTLIDGSFEADTFFPVYDPSQWRTIYTENYSADADNTYPYTFLTLEKSR